MELSLESVEQLAAQHYGLQVKAAALSGYDELNFLLTDNDGKKYIFKVATDEHGLSFLDAQLCMLHHLSKTQLAGQFQKFALNSDGIALTKIIVAGKNYYLRILSFLDGNFWVEQNEHNTSLYSDLGNFLGSMDRCLENFSHPAMHRYYNWDISHATDANEKLKYIGDTEKRRIAAYFLLQFETEVSPVLSSLRHAYVHNDANDYNVLVKENRIAGLIDFGDMVYTALVNNLAVACTYAMLSAEDPLQAAPRVVRGYHQSYPLQALETDLLYYLIGARLCISVTQSAYNASLNSDNKHHFITEKPAWELLYKLIEINPIKVQHEFRMVCGFPPLIATGDYSSLLSERKKYIGRNLSISYDQPLKIVKGALQYLYDDKGRTFIDCVNNVSHVGHCHPTVVKAMQKQIATLNTNTRYLHEAIVDYAKALTKTLPSRLSVCYFTNSGSEANDLAIRMSRHFTGQKDVIVLDHAYHGTSTVAMEMSPYKFDGKGGGGQMPYVHKAVSPDLYRGPYQYGDGQAGKKYAQAVEQIIEALHADGKAPAAFICETLLGVGGQIPLPENYLEQVYDHVRKAGGVCIADEVQVGFGRVGDAFWGFELQGVEPDIVVLGKPIANGHPLAAVVVTTEIADAFNNGMEYFNTFGGNPVSMVTGLSVLNVIEGECLQEGAKQTGSVLMEGCKELMGKHEIIGDVRGHGLFVGIELVKDRMTKQPAVPEIDYVVQAMKDRGFLLSTDGPLHNVLKIKPPLVFHQQNAKALVKSLDEVLENLSLKR